MSYHRSYFEKNNTILRYGSQGSEVNTAKNPNTEIFYGSGFSKFIFKLDLTNLKNKIDNGILVLNENTRHTLNLTNTIFGDEALLGARRGTGRQRAVSFELVLFKVPEFWDEGVGFDYEQAYDFTSGNLTFDIRPSNWDMRTSLSGWTEEGIYAVSGDTIGKIGFDNGNENISIDITDYINGIIISGHTDYGLGLAFDYPYQYVSSETDQSVSFFTKYTQTFWEPYLETVFDDVIDDNRDNFTIDIERNLYLYVDYMGNRYDLDNLPTVDVLDYNRNPIPSLTGLPTTKIRKGVYKVTFGLSGQLCDGKRFYYDKWCNINIQTVPLDCIIQKFVPKPFDAFFSIGENETDASDYVIQFEGVKLNEKIKRGSTRKIVTTFRSISQQKGVLLDEVYYRIYVKEGRTHVNVFDWTEMDRTNQNSFILDTSYMIPREYHIEIKARINSEDVFYRDEIKFEIISEK
jgi:hypothetical protein